MKKTSNLSSTIAAYSTVSSWENIPHVSFIYEADITDLYQNYLFLKEKNSNITFNTVCIKLIAEAIHDCNTLFSNFYYNRISKQGKFQQCSIVNVSIPWIFPSSEMIPILIKDVYNKKLKDLSLEIMNINEKILKTNVNELLGQVIKTNTINKLKKFDLSVLNRLLPLIFGGTRLNLLRGKEKYKYYEIPEEERLTSEDIGEEGIIISNIGSLLKKIPVYFTLLEIIEPKVIAIGLSPIQDKPLIKKNEQGQNKVEICKILPICIAFDHRAMNFNSLIPFINNIENILNNSSVIKSW